MKITKRIQAKVLGMAMLACTCAAFAGCTDKDFELEIGAPMPEFKLTETVGSKTLLGKPTLIVLFATWCPGCQAELTFIQDEYNAFKADDKITFVAIGREETTETVEKYWSDHKLSIPVYADPNRKVYSLFASRSIPRCYLFDADGKLVYKCQGYSPEQVDELHKMIQLRASI